MLFKTLFLFLITMSFTVSADTSFEDATKHLLPGNGNEPSVKVKEAWVKYTCNGPITPRYVYPIRFADIVSFHYPVKLGGNYPSFKELQEQNRSRFEKAQRICSEKRLEMTDRTGWNGQWLGWETVYYESRIIVSEVLISNNLCRQAGAPCATSAQCCSSRAVASTSTAETASKVIAPVLVNTCNQDTNTCEARTAVATSISAELKK